MLLEHTTGFSTLTGQPYIALTTFRKNGQSVMTPVWFAQRGDKLYVMTGATTGKVRRIHNNAQVEVTPCTMGGDPLGASLEAMAVILPDDQGAKANRLLIQKYGWQKRIYDFTLKLRARKQVFLEITPM